VEGADEAVEAAFAMAAATAGRARVGLGLAADGDYLLPRVWLHAHGLRSLVTELRYRCPRTQAVSVHPSITYGVCRAPFQCRVNAECPKWRRLVEAIATRSDALHCGNNQTVVVSNGRRGTSPQSGRPRCRQQARSWRQGSAQTPAHR